MELSYDEAYQRLDETPAVAKQAILAAEGDEQLVDVLGVMRFVERSLGEQRRDANAEVEGNVAGSKYRQKQGRRCDRSYNTHSLLMKFADAFSPGDGDVNLVATILRLMEADVLRLQWQWTNLKKLAQEENMTLTIAQHEITEGEVDDEGRWIDIGEVWSWGSASYAPAEG